MRQRRGCRARLRAPWAWLALALGVVTALGACGGGDTNAGFDVFARDGGDATTKPDGVVIIGVDATPDAEVAGGDAFACVPNLRTCISDQSWALCSKSGKGHGLETQCTGAARCEPDTGLCKIPFCKPKSTECVGISTYQVCNPSGTGWEVEYRRCAIGQICSDGACHTCFPGALSCADATTPGQCDATGDTITPASPCPQGQGCHELTGECRPNNFCAPGAPYCASLTSYHDCLPSGTGHDSLVRGCHEGTLCKNNQCVPLGCVPLVMLLVDRSGSMAEGGKWAAVRAGVKSLVADNPAAAIGLMAFPTDGKCGAPTYPSLPLNYQSQAELDAWFDATQPLGATPLALSVRATALVAESIWGASGGALVVLSDGQDVCSEGTSEAMLATWTAALLAEHNVRTYAIGYNFTEDPAELNAIAVNGGTDFTTYLPAGTEAELKNAFKAVIADFKSCVAPAN